MKNLEFFYLEFQSEKRNCGLYLAPANNSRNKSQLSLMKSISWYQSPLAGLEGFTALICLHPNCVSALLEPVILAKRNKCCQIGSQAASWRSTIEKTLQLFSFRIGADQSSPVLKSQSNSIFTSYPNSINSVVLTFLTKHAVTFSWSSNQI